MRSLVPTAQLALVLFLGCSEAFQHRLPSRTDTRHVSSRHLPPQATCDGWDQHHRRRVALNPHHLMRALAVAAWAFLPLQPVLAGVPPPSGGVDVFAEAMKELSSEFEGEGPTQPISPTAGAGTRGGKDKALSGAASSALELGQGSSNNRSKSNKKVPLSLEEMLQTKRRSNFEPLTHGL